MSEESNILKALIVEVRRLSEAVEQHNDIMLSHYAATGEIELEENFPELDS